MNKMIPFPCGIQTQVPVNSRLIGHACLVWDDVVGLNYHHPHKLICKYQQILLTNTSDSRDI